MVACTSLAEAARFLCMGMCVWRRRKRRACSPLLAVKVVTHVNSVISNMSVRAHVVGIVGGPDRSPMHALTIEIFTVLCPP